MLKTVGDTNYQYFGRKNKMTKTKKVYNVRARNCLGCRAYQEDKCK